MTMSPWQLERGIARLTLGGLQATLRLAAPDEGIGQLCLDGRSRAGHIQQVICFAHAQAPRAVLQDAYLRGDDMIATYGQTEGLPFRPQVYWRAVRPIKDGPAAVATVDAIVSVETSLLQSRPCVDVATSLPVERLCLLDGTEFEVARGDGWQPTELAGAGQPGCVLIRLPSGGPSCAVLVHPDDFHTATAARAGGDQMRVVHQFFARPLEKGVILRARLRTAFVSRQGDLAAALAWYRALLAERLPLTA